MHIVCFCFVWYSNTKFKCWALLRFIVESPLSFCFLSFSFVLFELNIDYYYCIYTFDTSISSFSHSMLVLWLKFENFDIRNYDIWTEHNDTHSNYAQLTTIIQQTWPYFLSICFISLFHSYENETHNRFTWTCAEYLT